MKNLQIKLSGKVVNENIKQDLDNLQQELGLDSRLELVEFLYDEYTSRRNAAIEAMSDGNTKLKGVAFERVHAFVEAIKKHNEEGKEERIYIGSNLVRREVSTNYNTIRTYFDKYGKSIDNHNEEYELNQSDMLRFRDKSKYPRDEKGRLDMIGEILRKYDIYNIIRAKKKGN